MPDDKPEDNSQESDYRLTYAELKILGTRQTSYYQVFIPLPSRRVAAYDKYPDFFFSHKVYRSDGRICKSSGRKI